MTFILFFVITGERIKACWKCMNDFFLCLGSPRLSFRWGHANLLHILPILWDILEETRQESAIQNQTDDAIYLSRKYELSLVLFLCHIIMCPHSCSIPANVCLLLLPTFVIKLVLQIKFIYGNSDSRSRSFNRHNKMRC